MSSSKRNKKMKIIKIKRGDDSDSSAVDIEDDAPVTVKMKSPILIDPKIIGQINRSDKPDKLTNKPSTSTPVNKKKKRGKDSGTSSEEERWLDAIESGKLEDVDDELKKIKRKDPKLMTARQRAMYERNVDKDKYTEMLMSLPSGYKEKVAMSEEDLQKAALKSQRRKQMADEKREKDKKRTMERLLKKQDTKNKSTKTKSIAKKAISGIRYIQNINQTLLCFPEGVSYSLVKKNSPEIPKVVKCGVDGCENVKKYNCSKTNVPLCSFKCYKLNLKNAEIRFA